MKVHYINILLFALPLNILAHNKNKIYTTPHHTPKISTTRLLCECELYMPNYYNDPEMKEVMENFNKQTQQRFEKYEEHMVEKRQECKDKCDKEIQKIILKDKLEKQMAQQFATLQTDIQSDAIPTCACEKSMADKTEKFCLNCGKTMGGVAPGWGLVSGLMYAGWSHYAATTFVEIAKNAGIAEGVKAAIDGLKGFSGLSRIIPISQIKKFVTATNYSDKTSFVTFVEHVNTTKCVGNVARKKTFCNFVSNRGTEHLVQRAEQIAENAASMAKYTETQVLEAAPPATNALTTAIIASVIAIVVIVLIMVIIYLILRYRRKKKMKKKIQYIKLLEE
ncbi:rifin [Plasmodium reichenowi]|uniref:Rifin n=1 Tax=Plasmodium reichenowi TaxID=5854 RepID=A0A060RLW6_PLARE|nr:rifin [Plasmodium reichenowi]